MRLYGLVWSVFMVCMIGSFVNANFYSDVEPTWGHNNVRISQDGGELQLALDNYTGSGFQSYQEILFGKVSVMLKLVPGNSAGTVTTFYLTSERGQNSSYGHDEIDMEFLGNQTGEPYVLHTNVYVNGSADKEQRFYLWFDPTTDFHNYTILWSSEHILFVVDGIPIRAYKNYEGSNGVGFPSTKPMRLISSLWNGDQWATQGGRIKIDWMHAPFIATYANFTLQGNVDEVQAFELDYYSETGQLQWIKDNFMLYDYCSDLPRFNNQLPTECYLPHF